MHPRLGESAVSGTMVCMYRRPAPDVVTTTELEIRRSRFITLVTRAVDEEAARAFIAEVRGAYPDARHHCSAYIHHVDGANPVERSSDDGEPSGTAGAPMLEVLRGSGLLDVAVVVVRYFGGVKLGTGGLVRAYSDAVSGALDRVPVVTRARRELYAVTVGHADAGRLESELRNRGIDVTGTDYGVRATIRVAVAPGDGDALGGTLAAVTQGTVEPERLGVEWIELP